MKRFAICSLIVAAWPLVAALTVNEDNSRFFSKLPPERMTRDELRAFVDSASVGGHVARLVFCASASRASYASRVVEPVWADLTGAETNAPAWPANAKRLADAGIDPYREWIDASRRRGISPWLSLRLNDLHGCLATNAFQLSTFWRTRRDLYRVPGKDPLSQRGAWTDFALDYSHDEVRRHYLRLAEELLTRYDADGLELDFLRFPRHLTPGREREQAPLMTKFVWSVRMAANAAGKARGRRIALSARVPEWREAARAFGLDVATWVREGLVDEVVPCNMWAASNFDLRIDEWTRELAAIRPSVRVTPGTDFSVNGESGTQNLMDYAAYCGWADCMYARGASDFYLFNVSYLAPETQRTVYMKGLGAGTVAGNRRRYPLTYHDGVAEGMAAGKALPANDRTNCAFRVFCGRAFPARTVSVLIGLTREQDEFAIRNVMLNGVRASGLPEREKSTAGFGVRDRTKSVWRYSFPVSALKPGVNLVETGAMAQVSRVNWCEVEVVPPVEPHLSDFGAKGDGVTDDTEAFIRFFTAAKDACRRKVTIDPGVYLLAGEKSIPLYGNCVVVAEGAEFRFPERLGDNHRRVMFHGENVCDLRWRGGFFRGYVYDPAAADNKWEPHSSSRGIVLETTRDGRTDSVHFSEIGGEGLSGAAVSVYGYLKGGVTNRATNVDVRDCSLVRCGNFMWDYGFLWERRTYPELFAPEQVELANRYDDLSAPVEKSFWRWGPKGIGPGKGGIDINKAANVIVSGCRMNACGDAMHVAESHHVVFNGKQITGARMGAFFIAHFCKDVTITGNTVDGTNGSRVMSVEKSTEDITIVGNTFRNGGRGSWINQPKNIIIANNIFCENTLKCTPETGKGRHTYHEKGGFEKYPEIYFTTYVPRAEYGPVILRDNIFTLSPHASLAVAFRNGGRGIIFENNVFRGAKRDVYVGPHCDMPRMSGNVGLGNVIREIGDKHSGGGLPEDQWSGEEERK